MVVSLGVALAQARVRNTWNGKWGPIRGYSGPSNCWRQVLCGHVAGVFLGGAGSTLIYICRPGYLMQHNLLGRVYICMLAVASNDWLLHFTNKHGSRVFLSMCAGVEDMPMKYYLVGISGPGLPKILLQRNTKTGIGNKKYNKKTVHWRTTGRWASIVIDWAQGQTWALEVYKAIFQLWLASARAKANS